MHGVAGELRGSDCDGGGGGVAQDEEKKKRRDVEAGFLPRAKFWVFLLFYKVLCPIWLFRVETQEHVTSTRRETVGSPGPAGFFVLCLLAPSLAGAYLSRGLARGADVCSTVRVGSVRFARRARVCCVPPL